MAETPEAVAFALMEKMAMAERRAFNSDPGNGWSKADREWILRTYYQCLCVVRGAGTADSIVGQYTP